MSDYEKPKQRKGHTLTAVWWDRAGRVIRTTYERTGRSAAPAPGQAGDQPAPAPRGLLAAERATKRAASPDLFD